MPGELSSAVRGHSGLFLQRMPNLVVFVLLVSRDLLLGICLSRTRPTALRSLSCVYNSGVDYARGMRCAFWVVPELWMSSETSKGCHVCVVCFRKIDFHMRSIIGFFFWCWNFRGIVYIFDFSFIYVCTICSRLVWNVWSNVASAYNIIVWSFVIFSICRLCYRIKVTCRVLYGFIEVHYVLYCWNTRTHFCIIY